jgi:hypothetical protein
MTLSWPDLMTNGRIVIRPNLKAAHIEITESWSYSIGSGPVSLWVSGQGGWYEIKPAQQYRHVYNKMCQGISLYYTVMEIYENADKDRILKKFTWKTIDLKLILSRYAAFVGDGVYFEEAIDRCHDHASFLLAQFGKEQIFKWRQTSFYDWMRKEHIAIAKQLKDVARGLKPPLPSSPKAEPEPSPETQSPTATLPVRGRGRSRLAKSSGAEAGGIDVDMQGTSQHQDTTAAVKIPATRPAPQISTPTAAAVSSDPVEALKALLVEIAGESNPAKATPSSVCNKIYFKCQIRHFTASKDIVSYYAAPLAAQLPAPWQGTPLHHWLQDEAKKTYTPSDKITVADMPTQLQRRKGKQAATRAPTEPVPKPLLPRPRVRRDHTSPVGDLMDTESDDIRERHPRPAGKGAGLRLFTSKGRKRFTADLDDDDEESQGSRRGPKSARTNHSADEDIDDEPEDTTGELQSSEDEQLGLPKETVRLVLSSERIPNMSPSGPNGTWVCGEPDCGHVVRSGDNEEGKQFIQDHFRQHEMQAEKVNLAMTEGLRGQMPIK